MGADYYAYAIIGCEIDPKALWESHPIKQCKHNIPEGSRFCPECGKPNQPIITYRRRFGEDRESYDSTEKDFLRNGFGYEAEADGLHILTSTDGRGAVAGVLQCVAHDSQLIGFRPIPVDPDYITIFVTQAEALLKKHGLWDKEKFGLYAVQYCSY